ncbi:radial spoke head 10 homolog B-like [Dendronephthya gigantea]|uniref:radial spoke head 10 homolog B-like n=1 Tax=Dendronephthya gigantea TaxID=151771 RepID=UPI00106C975C|nr:radial spoke head 10 homolog B-like [Dendronephthya gigantea]
MPQFLGDSSQNSPGIGEDQDEVGDAQSSEEQNDVIQEPETPAFPVQNLPYDAMRSEPLLTNVLVELYDGETDEQGFLHGYGTAYFQGGNIYKGHFQRGLMHGKGKYIWQNRTIYDGDFLHNRLHGYGAYIWPDDSVYEGEVINGLRHGQGTFTCSTTPCVYSGMWRDGKRHGQGMLKYDKNGVSYYQGEWCENQRQGFGTRRYASGNVYEGNWKNNVRHGKGTMNWYTTNEKYTGDWYKGVQQGYGEHTWFLRRIKGSQYPLRNRYVGSFVNGLREGHGVFYYASGAKYDGEWVNNMKHGHGTFVFKNGMVFKGVFDNDHMLEYPDINPSGMITPDISSAGLPVQRPATPASSILSADWANGLELNIAFLFDDREIDLDERELETQEVNYVMLQHISKLKKIYSHYSSIGVDKSQDNTSVMTLMQFCRFLKDIKIHGKDASLPEILRLISSEKNTDPYYPWENILIRDFLTSLVIIANHLFADEYCHDINQLLLPWCLSRLVTEHVVKHAGVVGGVVYTKPSITMELSQYAEKAYGIYQYWISQAKQMQPNIQCVNMRYMLWMLKDYGLINEGLSAKHVIDILASDDSRVIQDEFINLEVEVSFLEVLEALVLCAEVYVTDDALRETPTPHPTTVASSQAASAKSRNSSASGGRLESPESRISSHSVLNVIEEKPEDDQTPTEVEQKPADAKVATPINVGIPLLSITASSTDESKQLVIDDLIDDAKNENECGDSQDVGESRAVDVGNKKCRDGQDEPVIIEDDHRVWCMKMSIFFKKKFFAAADEHELLNKIAQKNV